MGEYMEPFQDHVWGARPVRGGFQESDLNRAYNSINVGDVYTDSEYKGIVQGKYKHHFLIEVKVTYGKYKTCITWKDLLLKKRGKCVTGIA